MFSTVTFEPLSLRHIAACVPIAASAPDPWKEQDLMSELRHPNRIGFVAIRKEGVAGFVCFHLDEDTAELAMLAVDENQRQQGLGGALLQHSFIALQASGTQRIFLEVRASNEAAIALYQKLGFTTLACRPALYNNPLEDGYTMEKIL